MKVKFRELIAGCKPARSENGAWYDLKAAVDVIVPPAGYSKTGAPDVMIPLGFAMEIPVGWCALVAPRSSTPKHFGIRMANSIGVIDWQYCGPDDQWYFPADSMLSNGGFIKKGQRIAQMMLVPCVDIEFEESSLRHNKNRGGFGTSGKE